MDQINKTPFPDVLAQMDYWSKFPPLHLMFRAFVGIEDKGKPNPIEERLASMPAADFTEAPRHIRDWLMENAPHV